MKSLFFVFCLALSIVVKAQIGFTHINHIEMDMALTEVEKLIQQKIIHKDDFTPVKIQYKGAEIYIIFHTYSNGSKYVYRMWITTPRLQLYGKKIGMGSSLKDFYKMYDDREFEIIKKKESFYTDPKAEQSILFYTRRIDENGNDEGYQNFINFSMKKGKVYKIIIGRTEDEP